MPRPTLTNLLSTLSTFIFQCGCFYAIMAGLLIIHPGLLLVAAGLFFLCLSDRW